MLAFIHKRLVNYDIHGDFSKRFIHSTGGHLKGLKQFDCNIKLKLRRDTFLSISDDGNVYLMYAGGEVKYDGIVMFNWRSGSMESVLSRLESFIKNPDMAIEIASKRLDPILMVRNNSKGMWFGMAKSELTEAQRYANVAMDCAIPRR